MTVNPFDADRPPEVSRTGGRRRRGGGRRRDDSLMVPDVQFDSYYGRQVVKPAPWESDIPAYIFLGGLAAGSGLLGAGATARDLPALRRNSRYAALAALAAGGIALVRDLGKPSRALNMMRTVKLTSPMSVGSWILTAFGAFAGLAAASEAGRHLVDDDSGLGRVRRLADPVAATGSALLAPPLAAYTAVLLADTATPSWHESYRELPFVFVGSANAAAAGLALVTAPTSQTGPARKLAVAGAATELVAFAQMERTMGDLVAEPLHSGRAGALLKASKILTVGGALGAALFGRNRAAAAVSGLALMAGSACTRFGIFEAGIESAKDPRYTVTPQRERLERRRAQGVTHDSITTSRQ
ncbi:formate-dependent nitrite reductase membrane component NrfD [Phycicoccus badiiscoriae]|uniref:Formate-dependent nitrite reductase membrane component NrfD n=1 Tax=Pedococcus badiiscoriae TaxID=642776 RepID=A0A852W995_9MICO|nr:formate-dependent nitrite reductase membrane component NrfD [Pedococcus badiiscoriae]